MVAAVQDRRARQIGEEPESGDADQYPALDGGPRRQAVHRLDRDADRDRQQRGAVHEGGEDLESQQSEGALRRGGALRQVGDTERESERSDIGEHVAGVREQRQRVRHPAAHRLREHHDGADAQHDRYAAPALCAQRGAVRALNVERKSRRHQRLTSDIRMRTASACPGKPSASASAMMCAASCSSCRREYATTLMRFTKSYTPNGETYRAVAPVGNTWDGPAT